MIVGCVTERAKNNVSRFFWTREGKKREKGNDRYIGVSDY